MKPILLLLAFVLPACVTKPVFRHPTARSPVETRSHLSWMDESTTRQTVLTHFGAPYLSMDDGRILCFLLQETTERGIAPALNSDTWWGKGLGMWGHADYDLVVFFGPDGKVQEHSMRRLRTE